MSSEFESDESELVLEYINVLEREDPIKDGDTILEVVRNIEELSSVEVGECELSEGDTRWHILLFFEEGPCAVVILPSNVTEEQLDDYLSPVEEIGCFDVEITRHSVH